MVKFSGVSKRLRVGMRSLVALMIPFMVVDAVAGSNEISDKEPDYTKGETLGQRYSKGNNYNYSNLGPIGVIGNVWKSRTGKTARTIQRYIQYEPSPPYAAEV